MNFSLLFSHVLLKGKSLLLIFLPFTFGLPALRRTVLWRSIMGLSGLLSGHRNSVQGSDFHNYTSWLKQYPSGLESFESIMKELPRKKIVVFLDYDGTLSPIVDDPDRAFMSPEMREAVREVAKCFPTAIISGRSREKVKEFVKLRNLHYAGSHGLDIMAPNSDNEANGVSYQPAKKFLPEIQQIKRALEEESRKIEGALVEDNTFCVSVHFRHVHERELAKLEKKVETVMEKYPDFHVTQGKKVMEIRPTINWNKGHAMEYYLHTLGHNDTDDVVPLYIGDDQTDEDAFKVIQRKGQGIAILVASIPKHTNASYSLKDPSEVLAFLLRLARWRNSTSPSITTPSPNI
ncbi:probable trehalose-phosphate phosphatase C [Cucurbita pepo subsp. pepo]|uniref:probable trehalose-phosphate phosphatase C n=2 Tax=Cucurbita pepo subsp. pepo TaxID=3664 RepID=UPI000C9DA273|nr:probable trehalose-phosphate phosphatase C [Cucurbita pepo subsp. pepo]